MTQNANGGETKKLNMSGALAATAAAIALQPEAVQTAILASLPESDREAIKVLWASAASKSKVVLPCPPELETAYKTAYAAWLPVYNEREAALKAVFAEFAERYDAVLEPLQRAEDAIPAPWRGHAGNIIMREPETTKKTRKYDPNAVRNPRMRGSWNLSIDGKHYGTRAAAAQAVDLDWCKAHPTADVFDCPAFRTALDKEDSTIEFKLTAGEWSGKTKKFVESFTAAKVRITNDKGESIYAKN